MKYTKYWNITKSHETNDIEGIENIKVIYIIELSILVGNVTDIFLTSIKEKMNYISILDLIMYKK